MGGVFDLESGACVDQLVFCGVMGAGLVAGVACGLGIFLSAVARMRAAESVADSFAAASFVGIDWAAFTAAWAF